MSDDTLFKLIKLAVTLMSLLPRRVLAFFSDGLGLVWYKLDKRHREVVFKNIRYAFPGQLSIVQTQRLAKKIFKNTAAIIFEVIWSFNKTKEELSKYFEIKGLSHLKQAQEKRRGVVLLTCHMGNFELMVASVAKAGIKPYGIYRKLDFDPLERLLLEERQRFGTTMIPLRGAAKKIDEVLRNGDAVGTMLDQNVDWYKGVFVNYFGRPACTNNGLAKLVLRTNAAVVPMFIVKKNHTYVMEFLPEVPLQITHDPIKDVENNTQNYMAAIESMVRQCPEQYFWVHDRWKTKPYCLLNRDEQAGG